MGVFATIVGAASRYVVPLGGGLSCGLPKRGGWGGPARHTLYLLPRSEVSRSRSTMAEKTPHSVSGQVRKRYKEIVGGLSVSEEQCGKSEEESLVGFTYRVVDKALKCWRAARTPHSEAVSFFRFEPLLVGKGSDISAHTKRSSL